MLVAALLAVAAATGPSADAAAVAAHARACAGRDGWSDRAPPVRIYGNVYDVGTCGIVVLLVAGPRHHVLIDAAPADAAPGIVANIRALGFDPHAVALILSTHEHVDHAGGFAALKRLTGARLGATAAERPAIERGEGSADDPQRTSLDPIEATPVNRVVRDGEVVRIGPLRLTAHATPGHAPGSTSWTWTSCAASRCVRMAYADSLSAISADRYRFTDHPAYVATFRRSIAAVAALPCDLLVTPHPEASNLYARLAGTAPLINSGACAAYARTAATNLDKRLAEESGRR